MYLTLFQSTDFNNQCNCVWFFSAFAKNGNVNLDMAGAGREKLQTKIADPSKWKQNKQKQLRMEGKSYGSKCKKKDGEIVTKQPRAMGPSCTSNPRKKATSRLCCEMNEEARKKVFHEFWQRMNWAQRKQNKSTVTPWKDHSRGFTPLPFDGRWRKEASVQEHVPVLSGDRRVVCAQLGAEKSNKRE